MTDRNAFAPFAVGMRLLEAIRYVHPELEIQPSIKNLLGNDDVFADDFDVEVYIAREAEKVSRWQEYSKKWYLYE